MTPTQRTYATTRVDAAEKHVHSRFDTTVVVLIEDIAVFLLLFFFVRYPFLFVSIIMTQYILCALIAFFRRDWDEWRRWFLDYRFIVSFSMS